MEGARMRYIFIKADIECDTTSYGRLRAPLLQLQIHLQGLAMFRSYNKISTVFFKRNKNCSTQLQIKNTKNSMCLGFKMIHKQYNLHCIDPQKGTVCLISIRLQKTEPEIIHNQKFFKEALVIKGRFAKIGFAWVIPTRLFVVKSMMSKEIAIINYRKIVELGLFSITLILIYLSTLPIWSRKYGKP
jgi:hypothetical protein